MTRGEAELRCAELNAEGEEGGVWLPRQKSGQWEAVRVSGRGIKPNRPLLSETVEATPKPREPDDPRPSVFRDTPYGG